MKVLLVALNAQYMHVNLALRQILCCLKPGRRRSRPALRPPYQIAVRKKVF